LEAQEVMSETDAVPRRLCEATTDYPTIREAQTITKETANPIPPTLAQACHHRQHKGVTT